MKFRDKRTGTIYEPTEEVAPMMAANPNLEKVEEKPAKRPTKTAKAKSE